MDDDKLYWSAVGLLVISQRGSASFLQRNLGIGYNAAIRLMERAEREGIVAAPDLVGKREVLVTDRAERAARQAAEASLARLRERMGEVKE